MQCMYPQLECENGKCIYNFHIHIEHLSIAFKTLIITLNNAVTYWTDCIRKTCWHVFNKHKAVTEVHCDGHTIPDSATIATETPCFCAMNPSTEKTANPATKLVQPFSRHSQKLSLNGHKIKYANYNCAQTNTIGISCSLLNSTYPLKYRCFKKQNVLLKRNSLTCSSYCCICWSFPKQFDFPVQYSRRRTPAFLLPSRPGWREIH